MNETEHSAELRPIIANEGLALHADLRARFCERLQQGNIGENDAIRFSRNLEALREAVEK